jgi:hypothetical protein
MLTKVQQSEMSPLFSHWVRGGYVVARAEEDSRHRFRKRNSEASLLRLNFELSYPPFRYPDPSEEDDESIAATYIHEKQTKGQRIRGVPLQNEGPQDYPTEEIQNKERCQK